jgi:phosphatidylglycerol:prolipoprotein diacylglycerol transferase
LYPIIYLAKGLEIPSFFLVISLVLSVSLLWIVRRGEYYDLPKKNILDLSLLLMVASFIGARLMHVLYENLSYYAQDPVKIFYFWEGGFVYFGGMILALIAALFYLRNVKAPKPGLYFDAFAPVLSFAYGFGRIGCFLAGCCFGKECFLPWAVNQKHPTQLYALLWEVGAIFILLGLEKKDPSKRMKFLNRPGDLFVLWLALHATGRLIMEFFREDFRGDPVLGLSISSLLSLVLLIVSLSLLIGNRRFLPRRLK